MQRHRRVERGLPAHGRQDGVRPLLLDDLGHHVGRDRLDIGRIGQPRIGHDRGRVGVHQDDAVALVLQRLAGLHAGIIELAGLADHDRAGADDEDALDVGALGHERLLALALVDHLDEAVEEIVAVGRAGRGLGVILHREGRLVGAAQALVGAVEQRDVRHLDVLGQRLGQDAEAVVLRGDLDLAGRQVLDRLVGAAMAALHLARLAAQRQRQDLVAEADAEQRHLLVEHALDRGHAVACRRRRIARAVGQEHAVGLVAQDVLGRGGGRNDRDLAAGVGEAAQDVALGAVVDGDHVVLGLGELAVALAQRPLGLVPAVGLLGRHLDGEIHAVEAGPLLRRPCAAWECRTCRRAHGPPRRWARRRRGRAA